MFAKAPVPGKVKTRLSPPLSGEAAAALHRELVARTLHTATICPGIDRVELWCAPDASHPFFQQCASNFAITLQQQEGWDLGMRMHHALAVSLDAGCTLALLIGTDCPVLTPAYLCSAVDALNRGADVVLAPAEDGGYALIGLRRPQPQIFKDIPWGSEAVLQATRERIRGAGLAGHELPVVWDLDRPQDLARYRVLAKNWDSY